VGIEVGYESGLLLPHFLSLSPYFKFIIRQIFKFAVSAQPNHCGTNHHSAQINFCQGLRFICWLHSPEELWSLRAKHSVFTGFVLCDWFAIRLHMSKAVMEPAGDKTGQKNIIRFAYAPIGLIYR